MRRRVATFVPSLLLLACPAPEPATLTPEPAPKVAPQAAHVVFGRVLDHEGAELAGAHIRLTRTNSREPVLEEELPADGSFRVELPGSGVYVLNVAGVDHAQARLSMAIDGEGSVEVDARLGTYARAPEAEHVRLRLRWVDGEGQAGEAFERDAPTVEGRPRVYALELEPPPGSSAVQYQLVDPVSQRSYNGPGARRWVYDGGGDFWAERPLDGQPRLELDLAELPPSDVAPNIEVHGDGVTLSRQDEARTLLDPFQTRLRQALTATPEGDTAPAKTEICASIRPIALEAREAIEDVEDTELRKSAALEWAWLFGQFGRDDCLSAADLRWVFELAPADDPAWAFLSLSIGNLFYPFGDDPEMQAMRRQLAAAQRDPGLLAHLLYLDIVDADERGDQDAVRELHAKLVRDYPDSYSTMWARRYDPNRPLQVGRTMPEWRFDGLDGTPVSSTELHGRPYLLEVWASWCGPCIGEMEALHAAHEALGGQAGPIAFVSVSFDETVDIVRDFRRDEWPMPWVHAHVPPTEHEALYDAWHFSGIPLMVLIDGEGQIVETEEALRGEELLPTLKAFLEGQ